MPTRRAIMQSLSATLGVGALGGASMVGGATGKTPSPVGQSMRLRPGDVVGLIEPASASDDPFDLQLVEETVRALGLVPKRAAHLLNRYGYLAGQDRDRAADVNAMFADKDVRAIFAVRGGWGCARILPYLDYGLIRANPKLLIGYSDITALHMAIAAKAGFVTIHGPNGGSSWGKATVESFRQVAFDGVLARYQNPVASDDRLVQNKWRTRTITPGTARGKLLGGNLTVLTALVGTQYLPDFKGAILFLEDVDEAEYRIDRMLTQLGQAGILGKVAGIAFGQCTDCKPRERGLLGFGLSEVLMQHFSGLKVPVFQGSFFGHMPNQFSIPVGARAEIDAGAGTLTLLEPAVV